MIRTILALALVAVLTGCDSATSDPVVIPSGNQSPTLRATLLSAMPTDSPIIQIEWAHQDSISLCATERWTVGVSKYSAAQGLKTGTNIGGDGNARFPGSGKIQVKGFCRDSAIIVVSAYIPIQAPIVEDTIFLKCK